MIFIDGSRVRRPARRAASATRPSRALTASPATASSHAGSAWESRLNHAALTAPSGMRRKRSRGSAP